MATIVKDSGDMLSLADNILFGGGLRKVSLAQAIPALPAHSKSVKRELDFDLGGGGLDGEASIPGMIRGLDIPMYPDHDHNDEEDAIKPERKRRAKKSNPSPSQSSDEDLENEMTTSPPQSKTTKTAPPEMNILFPGWRNPALSFAPLRENLGQAIAALDLEGERDVWYASGKDPNNVDLGDGNSGPKYQPNKKFACKQYSPVFMEWLENVREMIEQSAPVYEMCVLEENVPEVESGHYRRLEGAEKPPKEDKLLIGSRIRRLGQEEWLENNGTITIPQDLRCVGCRRYYFTKDPKRSKVMAFVVCPCNVRSASYCVRCKVIQWAMSASDNGNPVAKCTGDGCDKMWSPQDVCILRVGKV